MNAGRVAAVLGAVALLHLVSALQALRRFTGTPGGALDDAYIHFQFATGLARGRFFEWTPGGGYSTGATSILWPVLLAPAYWIGLREERMVVWAAGLGALGLWACAWCAYRVLSHDIGSRAWGGLGAALVLTSGPLLFGFFGGMEIPLVAALALGIVWADQASRHRTALVLAALLPLARPEWTVVTVFVVLLYAREHRGFAPSLALAPLAAYLALNLALTGRMATNGAVAKSLAYDADLTTLGAAEVWARSVLELFRTHMGGLVPIVVPMLAAAAVLRPSRTVRLAAALAGLGLAASLTVADPFRHWNRYQVPAVPLLLMVSVAGLASLASVVRNTRVRAMVAGLSGIALVGWQAAAIVRHRDQLAYGSRDIQRQQVRMGRWMRAHLPPGSVVALNDAGAIPLFSGLPAIDLMGLGTAGFAAPWREGEGAVFEALERLPPARRPRYFAIYTRWVNLPDLYGPVLHRVTLTDNRTCGDAEKVLLEARWESANSGDRPLLPHAGVVVDEVDVADLESERAHGYAIDRPARTIYRREPCAGRLVSDGGRVVHAFERMRVALRPGRDARLVWRTDAWLPADVRVSVDGTLASRARLPQVRAFIEPEVVLGAALLARERPEVRVELDPPGEMSTFHYWVLQ